MVQSDDILIYETADLPPPHPPSCVNNVLNWYHIGITVELRVAACCCFICCGRASIMRIILFLWLFQVWICPSWVERIRDREPKLGCHTLNFAVTSFAVVKESSNNYTENPPRYTPITQGTHNYTASPYDTRFGGVLIQMYLYFCSCRSKLLEPWVSCYVSDGKSRLLFYVIPPKLNSIPLPPVVLVYGCGILRSLLVCTVRCTMTSMAAGRAWGTLLAPYRGARESAAIQTCLPSS